MEQKWAGQLEKINFFVYCCKFAHLIFLIFHIHLEGIKGYKLAGPDAIFGKILVLPILAIFVDFLSKNQLFCLLLKIGSLDFFDILHEFRDHYGIQVLVF